MAKVNKTAWVLTYKDGKNRFIPYDLDTGEYNYDWNVTLEALAEDATAYTGTARLQFFGGTLFQIANSDLYNNFSKWVLLNITPFDIKQSDRFVVGTEDLYLGYADSSFDGGLLAFDPGHTGDYRGRAYFYNTKTGEGVLIKAPVVGTVYRAFPMHVTPSGQHILCGKFDDFTVSFTPEGGREWEVEILEDTNYGVFVGTAGNEKFLIREKFATHTTAFTGDNMLVDMNTGAVTILVNPWGDPANGGPMYSKAFNPTTGQNFAGHDGKLWLIEPDGSAQLLSLPFGSTGGTGVQFDNDAQLWYVFTHLTPDNKASTLRAYVIAADFSSYTEYPMNMDLGYLTGASLVAFADGSPFGVHPCSAFWQAFIRTTESELCPPEPLPAVASGGAWDITTASYVQKFSTVAKDQSPSCVTWKPDGTKMFFYGNGYSKIYEYNVSTPWDVSTAVFARSSIVLNTEQAVYGLEWKPDGTALWMVGIVEDLLFEYAIGIPWQVTNITLAQSISVNAEDDITLDVTWKPDGTKMYTIGNATKFVREWDVSTPWDISTASVSKTFFVGDEVNSTISIAWKPDGTSLFMLGISTNGIYEYQAITPWDIGTLTFIRSLDISTMIIETTPYGLEFKPDGTKLYVVGDEFYSIYEFDVG